MKSVRVLCVSGLLALITVAGGTAAQADTSGTSAAQAVASTSRGISSVVFWRP
jgi:hypothetical protein